MSTVFHIGYHKTASTWLQGEVFPHLDGRMWPRDQVLVDTALRHLARADDEDYVPGVITALRDEYQDRHGQSVLFSYEGLSGRLWKPDDSGRRSLDRISQLEPSAHILVVVREQRSMLRSIYFQYLYEGGTLGPEAFLDDPSGNGWRFEPEHLAYDRLIRHATDLFGRDAVGVLPYELLTADPGHFLGELADILEARIDESSLDFERRHHSPSAASLRLMARWNRTFRFSALHRDPSLFDLRLGQRPARFIRSRLDPTLRRLGSANLDVEPPPRWREIYESSNEWLSEHCSYDLTDLGYPMPEVDRSQ